MHGTQKEQRSLRAGHDTTRSEKIEPLGSKRLRYSGEGTTTEVSAFDRNGKKTY